MEGFLVVAALAAGEDTDKQNAAKEIAEECKDTKHENRCEQAILIGKCMEEGAKKRNLSADRR